MEGLGRLFFYIRFYVVWGALCKTVVTAFYACVSPPRLLTLFGRSLGGALSLSVPVWAGIGCLCACCCVCPLSCFPSLCYLLSLSLVVSDLVRSFEPARVVYVFEQMFHRVPFP
jgi:hypothetical protein